MTRSAVLARAWLIGLLLCGAWIVALRAPTWRVPTWNVDEGIQAAAASVLDHGGVMYRDAIDQRTPVAYCAYALIFALFGVNNMTAVHLALALMIAATAVLLGLMARRLRGRAAGLWTAVIFAALSYNFVDPGDSFAAHTEWFLIFFSTLGAWIFWRAAERRSLRGHALAGAAFAGAFLSKQPALLELGAPLAALLVAALLEPAARTAFFLRRAGALLAGFAAVTGAVCLYYAARGAWHDFYFYTWAYNFDYYGAAMPWLRRLPSLDVPVLRLWRHYAALAPLALAMLFILKLRLLQFHPGADRARHPARIFALAWFFAALAATALGGRGFEHYSIELIPALSLVCGWGAGALTEFAAGRVRRFAPRAAAGTVCALLGLAVVVPPFRDWNPPPPKAEPWSIVAQFVRENSAPDDTIFVWGFHPEIYTVANRRPASRFLYCTYLTGLIPWTNLDQPDTSYAIVPGAPEQALHDLERSRPRFIIDTSPRTYRGFQKYPPENFPWLWHLLTRDYAVMEPDRFGAEGFRLFYRLDPAPRTPATGAAALPSAPFLGGQTSGAPVPTPFVAVGDDPEGKLTQLEILVNGVSRCAVRFPPAAKRTVRFYVPFDRLGAGDYRVEARALTADGRAGVSAPQPFHCAADAGRATPPPDLRLAVAAETLAPIDAIAPNGFFDTVEHGRPAVLATIPSRLTFPAVAGPLRFTATFGVRDAAWEGKNDIQGARFTVELDQPGGTRATLFSRFLDPKHNPADRGPQTLAVDLPAGARGKLVLVIDPGPSGNFSYGWTYWADLLAAPAPPAAP